MPVGGSDMILISPGLTCDTVKSYDLVLPVSFSVHHSSMALLSCFHSNKVPFYRTEHSQRSQPTVTQTSSLLLKEA